MWINKGNIKSVVLGDDFITFHFINGTEKTGHFTEEDSKEQQLALLLDDSVKFMPVPDGDPPKDWYACGE